jgi:hypothetical protein
VIHVVNDVLIPPRKPIEGESRSDKSSLPLFADNDGVSELTIEELMARLEPLVGEHRELEGHW